MAVVKINCKKLASFHEEYAPYLIAIHQLALLAVLLAEQREELGTCF